MSAVANKLRQARSLIERGWTQGSYVCDSETGSSYCTEGALGMVDGYLDAAPIMFAAVGGYHLISWNDAPERTQADVLAAFDRAISIAESGQ